MLKVYNETLYDIKFLILVLSDSRRERIKSHTRLLLKSKMMGKIKDKCSITHSGVVEAAHRGVGVHMSPDQSADQTDGWRGGRRLLRTFGFGG